MVEIWEPLGRYCRFERDERRARSSLRTICQIEMESCARFLPLQLKVAIYRLRADFQCNLAGAAEDAFAKVDVYVGLLLVFTWLQPRNGSLVTAAVPR